MSWSNPLLPLSVPKFEAGDSIDRFVTMYKSTSLHNLRGSLGKVHNNQDHKASYQFQEIAQF
jgi:hypothetical protein